MSVRSYGPFVAALALAWLSLAAFHRDLRAADDVLIADFEGDDYGGWRVTGEAFGRAPARGTLPNQMPVDGFLGRGLVNSYVGGDGSTGTLTSPPFRLERRYLQFLIGGGQHPGQTCLNLLVDDRVVRTATGPNDRAGGSERLEAMQWDLADLAGREAVLQIVDSARGGWGHINVDHLVLTDRRLPGWVAEPRREFAVQGRYLNLPVKTGAPKRRMRVEFEGRIVREFEIELADQMSGQSPDFWVFLDVTAWRNQRLTVVVDRLPENSPALERLVLEDELRTTQPLYREPLRPQFHFSSRRGWNNDPNGLVFADGEWHLFYQHNPYGWNWGNMHWGHAVSRDLVRWQELPIALYPRQFGDWAFSGSAVVDAHNTSGWGTPEAPPLVLAYTSTGRGECMAYSRDRGRTWQEYEGNPVVRHTGRDPRLLWHAPTKSWVMAVYTEQGSAKQIAFHVSPDLQHWQETSRIDGFYECPDLYRLPLDGNLDRQLWILSAADSNYLVGTFDGRKFVPTGERQRGNYGNCFYAAQTFSQAPGDRRVIIGWLQAPSPGMPFNQCFSVPCELTLRTSDAGPRLAWTPVPELMQLRSGPARTVSGTARPGQPLETGEVGELLDIECTVQPGMARQITLEVRGVRLTYDVAAAQLRGLDRTAPVPLVGGAVTLRVLVDRTTVELFADRGFVYLPLAVIPAAEQRGVRVLAEGDAASVQLQVHPLRSAW